MTTLYVVEKVGVYRHGIVLAKETEQEAREAIEAYIADPRNKQDADGHHEFELMRVDAVGTPVLVAKYTAGGVGMRFWDEKGRLPAAYSWDTP